MNNEKYDELYDLVQCGEQEEFTEEFKKLTSDEHKEFLTQFVVDFCECALQCKISKDSEPVRAFVRTVLTKADTTELLVDWIFGDLENPDLEEYLDNIEGDTNE